MNLNPQNFEAAPAKVYYDEPIRLSPERRASLPPARYREMRKLAGTFGHSGATDPQLFFRQGKLMEKFEDDYEFHGEFVQYFPTYQSMNDSELRGYFSWRTKVRQGNIQPTSLSFAFIYIYELLNRIGVNSPGEGFTALKEFQRIYGEIDPGINRYLQWWLKDYVVYYNLNSSLLEGHPEWERDRALLVLFHCREHKTQEVFDALNSLSSYNLAESRFTRAYPEEVRDVTVKVFQKLTDYYNKNRKNGICEKLFGKLHLRNYTMFRSAVFYPPAKYRYYVYRLNDIHRYFCHNGNWRCESFQFYSANLKLVGELLKNIDFQMRQKYHFASPLKAETSKLWQKFIVDTIDEVLQDRRIRESRHIKIDLTKLSSIRATALDIQNKLIVDSLEEAPSPSPAAAPVPPPTTPSSAPAPRTEKSLLTPVEIELLQWILEDRPIADFARSHNLMAAVAVDTINEKLFESFGDSVVDWDGDRPFILEDYLEELKGMVLV